MSQIDILKRAMVAVVLAGTATTLLVQQSAPASSFHTANPAPAPIQIEDKVMAPDFPAEPAMLVPKTTVRIQYVPIEASRDRMMPTPMFKG